MGTCPMQTAARAQAWQELVALGRAPALLLGTGVAFGSQARGCGMGAHTQPRPRGRQEPRGHGDGHPEVWVPP